ncbi:MAG: hypothetical protein UH625_11475 [Muribaculaceae bacterium]|nr:hypothetical protein [Muribaculaceae bacterium]
MTEGLKFCNFAASNELLSDMHSSSGTFPNQRQCEINTWRFTISEDNLHLEITNPGYHFRLSLNEIIHHNPHLLFQFPDYSNLRLTEVMRKEEKECDDKLRLTMMDPKTKSFQLIFILSFDDLQEIISKQKQDKK